MRALASTGVPAHLRSLVVEQDCTRYTAIDHAVWRFVLLQLRSRLGESAHPAYQRGLDATGISVDRIPSIAQMSERLERFGWTAVGVDGFIPPRAFQEFQACGILPIAAEIRRRDHLAYTPAPDIIHEAAGHAPILPDSVYAAYLRRIGDLGRQAFTLPEEAAVFAAVHKLSEVKERRGASSDDLVLAEEGLAAALAGAAEASEATRLSRLYWWTAEYGLVGRTNDYKLYGAGLLSSLGESRSCHDPRVQKIALDESAMDAAFDITRPQPRLYVVRDFDALHGVLDRAAATLAVSLGGAEAIARAIRSREVASVQFTSGAWAMGIVGAATREWLDIEGRVGFAWDEYPPETTEADALKVDAAAEPRPVRVVLGPLEGGVDFERALRSTRRGARQTVRFASGASVEGDVERIVRRSDGRVACVFWRGARVECPGVSARDYARYPMLVAGDLATACAGAVDPAYHPDTKPSSARVPAPALDDAASARLLEMYERAERAHYAGRDSVLEVFPAIVATIGRDYPDDWLLRWNLLETLLKAGADSHLARVLRSELERLEVAFEHAEPIASGLRELEGRTP
jgi:phenylalanine-4-hydroxylase